VESETPLQSKDFVVSRSGLRADLFSADEVRRLPIDADHELMRTVTWCEDFLGRPHPMVGRRGNVCPFIPEALMRSSLKFAVVALHRRGVDSVVEIEDMVEACREHFLAKEEADGNIDIFGSLILIFPDITSEEAPAVIDRTQRKLKPGFVQEGLMLGEFHSLSDTPGLRSRDFRPLRSPIPLLAIRHMVESDVDFLMALNDAAATRVKSLKAYLNFLGPSLGTTTLVRAREALRVAEAETLPEFCAGG
jgi:hypothetical protein